MQFRKVLVAGLLALGAAGGIGAAMAAGGDSDAPRAERHVIKHRMHGAASVEFTAMHNIMAELLSARTGKTTAEIQALFEKGGPHEAFDALGLTREDVQPLFKEARLKLIARATSAGLITSQQAEKLKAAKMEMREKRRFAPEAAPAHEDEDDED